MIINKLKIKDFRQFSGEQVIEFAIDKKKNITVIHGENGSGKTTLLNAITWCLYEFTGHDFEESDFLISKKAVAESKNNDEMECSVEMLFNDADTDYEIRRSYIFVSSGKDGIPRKAKEKFELYTKKDGQRKKVENPAVTINKIIPEEIHSYFFFNGERIDKLAMRSNSSEIRDAIKLLLGVTILERAIDHLKQARKKIGKELTENNQVNHQSKEIIGKLDALNDELIDREKSLEQKKKNVDALKIDQELIRGHLKTFKETKEIEDKRDGLLAEEQELGASIEEANKSLRKFITRKACFSFMAPVLGDVNEIFKNLKTNNILPSSVKEDFIKRLLKDHKCICTRELANNSDHYHSVEKLLEFSISKEVDQNISIMKSNLFAINEKLEKNPSEINELINTRSKSTSKLEKVNKQLDDVKKSLRGFENREEINNLTLKYDKNDDKIAEELKDQGKLDAEIVNLKLKIVELEKVKKNVTHKDQQTTKLVASLDFVDSLIEYTDKVYQKRIIEIREKLSQKINTLFRKICKKDYYIKMDDEFRIDVMDSNISTAKPVGKSTGENQITSLAFVGSILEFAKEIKEDKGNYGTIISKYGGTYPLVMDSPFGSLDKTYGRNIAESLPFLSEQIVLMVSSTQWRSEVKEGMSEKIGRQYYLCNHTPKTDIGTHASLTYNDKEYFLSKTTTGPEYTLIEGLK
jgi:DNA sulfur modification protein DndD